MRVSFFKPFFFVALLSWAAVVSGQELLTVTGAVNDKHSKEPLLGANVILVNSESSYVAVTDEYGKFKLDKVQPGKYALRISFTGYELITVPELDISAQTQHLPPFELSASSEEITEVVVSGNRKENNEALNPMAVASARSFTIETSERFAASLNDPGRLALSFAGVRGQSDLANGIVVRGNAPKGVLWRVEGIDVPDPNHFSQEGYGGGAVCMISGRLMGTSDFFSGAFPAKYGNAMSAVFDINLRKGDTQKRHYYLQAGMMGFEGGLEGPFIKGKNSSYLINYRYSTLKLFEKIHFDVGNTISTYQDLNFKFNFPTKKLGTFSVFGIGGMSELTTYKKKTKKTSAQDKTYDMAVVGVSHGISLNQNNYLHSVVAVSGNREGIDKDETYYSNQQTLPAYRIGASNMYLKSMTELDTRLSSRTSLVSGIVATGIRFNLDDNFVTSSSKKNGKYKNGELSYMLQAHSEAKYALTEKWTLLGGVHLLFFGYNHRYSIEPRAGINWQINKMNLLYVATGLHSRLESLACYMVRVPWQPEQPNRNIDFTRAFHAVLGYEFNPFEHLKLKAELYYQYLYDVPISTDENSSFSMLNFEARYVTMQLANNGLGKNYGIELTLEKSFSDNYYILANGSLFNSTYYAADGQWRNTRFNANYVSSFTAGKDFPFGKNNKSWIFGMNGRILWSGGERTEQTQFEEQLSDYFRLDTRVSISRNRERATWVLAVDIQNTTNRFNETTLDDIKPMGILPILSFRVEL